MISWKMTHTSEPITIIIKNGSFLGMAATRMQRSILSNLKSVGDVSIVSPTDDVGNTSRGTIFAAKAKVKISQDILICFK